MFVPTGRYDIADDTETTDSYGDPVDAPVPVAVGVPMSLIEQSDLTHREQSSRVDSVRYYAGVVGNTVTLKAGYRISSGAGETYIVDHIRRIGGPYGLPTRFDARRIDQK